ITKRFARTLALYAVDFIARPGEIHALLGENGAGKTTLMNIFAGRLRPDAGVATLDGIALRAGSPDAALRAGIAAVHQSPMLFERMTWEENLALGGFGRESRRIDLDGVAARARALAGRLGFELPPPGALIEQRSVAERVRLEVLRALSFDPRVLILDEPTGVLAPGELSSFLDLLRRLRGEGRIVILITHKLAEALAVADRITVLRDGRVVTETVPVATSESELARMMIGELASPHEPELTPIAEATMLLEIENLTYQTDGARVLDGISMQLHAGEIAGVAGVDGNGQVELVEVLAGVRGASSGSFRAMPDASAMAVIPQNRDLDGLILDMALWENLLLAAPVRARVSRRGWLDIAAARELCRELLTGFRIRADGTEAPAASLSGGNRQRLEVARALAQNPRVIVAHNICRGLDLAATAEVHRTLASFAADGGTVLLISSDLDELLAISTRLFVMSRGRIRETRPDERSPQALGLLIAGRWGTS
ncbi:MAG TPA: ATP-binding cassette domain-containing protein, partial [Candidatus Binataceae bacterium]|nr:ATP-binding cassette domain-containing protein [Candidatus Binataceae bacterium]